VSDRQDEGRVSLTYNLISKKIFYWSHYLTSSVKSRQHQPN